MKRLVPSAADTFGFIPRRFASFCVFALLIFGAVLAEAQTTNPPVNLQFALYFHRDGAQFETRGYTLQGPVGGGSLFPAIRLTRAGDYSGLFFGVDRHDLFKVDAATANRQSIDFADVSPQLAEQGWPTGLGFDHQRHQILLSSLGGEGYIHTYSETNGWRLLTSLKNWDVSDIAHHEPDDTIYVVQNSYISAGGETAPLYISRVGRDGAHSWSIEVDKLPFGIGYSDHYAELISVGGYLVLLLEPGRDTHDKGQPKESRIYLINPGTGQSTLTYRANWSPVQPNQPPTVSITHPSNGAGFTAGDRVTLNATASDADGLVQSLIFFVDGVSIGQGRPTLGEGGLTFFELEWIATAGTHVITARVTDHQGASRTSSGVNVKVQEAATSFSLQFYPVGGIHLGRGGQVFTRTYVPSGPLELGRLLPGMHVVPDGQGNSFGTYWHNVYKIDSSGTVQNLTLPTGMEEFSWTMGVTFDTRRNRLLVVSLGGDGFLYSYSVASNSWSVVANMNNHDYNSLLYDAERDLIYAAENGRIQKLNAQGQIVGSISLPHLDLRLGPGSYQTEMALVGNKLALLVDPVVYNQIGAGQESRIYMIDLATGSAQLTYRKVWPTMPLNQDPTVQIISPADGSHFAFGTPVSLRAQASDADGEVLGVQFFDNGEPLGLAAVRNRVTGTFDILWTPDGGSHTITANAVDNMGGTASARAITFTVQPPQPTVVSVRTIDAEATELSPDRSLDIAEFEVSVTGELRSDLRIQVSVHGSAVEGEDYQVVRKVVGIPAGSTRALVTIAPLSDAIAEKMETVVLRLEPAPTNTLPNYSYQIDSQQSEAAAVIYEREYPVHSTLELALPDDGKHFEPGQPIRVLAAAAGFPYISTVVFKANGQQIGTSVHAPPSGAGQAFAIEAEDFDYDGGKHLPGADVMPYLGGAYDGFSAVHNVDYSRRIDVTEGNIYRAGESPNVPMFSSPESTNRNRGTWEIETNFRIGWMDESTWFNYTRNFPAGAYRIYAGLAHGDPSATMQAGLYKVTSGRGTMVQNVEELGQFTGPATGNWNNTTRVPLTQNGVAVQVQLGGEQTLRFQGRSGDFDYLLLEPVNVVAPPRLVWHNFVWTNAPQGTHTITAEAVLPGGQVLTSSPVQITVGSNQPSSFVRRELPDRYIAGTPFNVVLNATPPAGTLAYAVEDIPPAGWTVSSFSHAGVFDTATGKVKFGPFTDAEARILTYRVTPPSNAAGPAEFTGSASRNGALFPVIGDRIIQGGTEFHPADRDRNKVITLVELTAYAAAWKTGETWPIAPSPIPASYVTRAAVIWKRGETYVFIATLAPPLCWSPVITIQPAFVESRNVPLIPAQRITVPNIAPGGTALVEIRATPPSGSTAYAIEESVPQGWAISESGDGIFDPATRKIRWGPFLDANPRNLAYRITAPSGVASSGRLSGLISTDGNDATIFGTLNRIVAMDEATAVTLIPRRNDSGEIELSISCAAGQTGVIEYSSDLQSWTALQSVTGTSGTLEIADTAGKSGVRFYRFRID